MQDDSITPNAPINEPDADEGSKVYANASTLAIDGHAPEIGDEVELTVKGTVNSVEGDVVCVSPVEVNGEPAPNAPAAKTEVPERDRLLAQAENDDNSY